MVKRIMGCVREYKKASLLAPLFVSLEVVLEVIIPFLMARLIDRGLNTGNLSVTLGYGLAMAVTFVHARTSA